MSSEMSDSDEEVASVPKRQKLIHYGTLEDHMKKYGRESETLLQSGINAGNINISDGMVYLFRLESTLFS